MMTVQVQPAPAAHALRPYQRKNVNEILACLARGESPLYVLPTGGGKTQGFCAVTEDRIGDGWDVCIFVHRVELLRQASARLASMQIDHGVIAPGHDLTSHRVHVASIDTVCARLDTLGPWLKRLRLGIPDEAHHSVAGKWDRVLQLPQQRLGVTATPCRTDGKGLGETGLFHRIVRGPSIRQLTDDGYLAPAHVYAPPSKIDLSKVAKRGGDFALGQLALAVDTDILTIQALRWYDKIAFPDIIAGKAPPPAVAFCTTVEHSRHVAEAFRRHGVLAASVDGGMSAAERDGAINGLADGKVQVLTSCELIGEGLDIPAVAAAFLLRPTESTGLILQQIGRSLRPHADKSHATVVDLVGNTARHGMYDADRQWDLKSGMKGRERAVRGTWRCIKCHRVRSQPDGAGLFVCDCGHRQTVRGFNPPAIDNYPPIAGIRADYLLGMKWKDAVAAMKTREDLVAFFTLYNMVHPDKCQNPVAMARMHMEQRNQYRAKFRAGGWR
jgi:superfamily II DNA or RNA helicase